MKKASATHFRAGFTFVELLASSTLIVLLMLLLVSMTDATTKTWQYTTKKIEQFQEARMGFESMTRRLSQATLNTYWDVEVDSSDAGSATPAPAPAAAAAKTYVRKSELRFISGPMSVLVPDVPQCPTHGVFFQAPLGFVENRQRYAGLSNMLNTWGYFLEVGEEGAPVPTPLKDEVRPKWRSRLKELMEPSERLAVYRNGLSPRGWFTNSLLAQPRPVRTLSENVVALILLPQLPVGDRASQSGKVLAPEYVYDSTSENSDEDINPHNQLPPIVQVVMVAIDETSAQRQDQKYPRSANFGLAMEQMFQDSEILWKGSDAGGTGQAASIGDLQRLENLLISQKLNYRIFNSNVILRGAKWGRENN